ncbi:MAG: hypothetical protein ACK5HL_04100 [Bacilli bacterium]
MKYAVEKYNDFTQIIIQNELNTVDLSMGKKRINDCIWVEVISFIDPFLIRIIIISRIKKKLTDIFNLFVECSDDEDDMMGSQAGRFLGVIEKFKQTMEREYAQFLEENYVNEIKIKLGILEKQFITRNKPNFSNKFRQFPNI